MVETVISIASKAAEYLVDPICAPLSYLFMYRRNVEDLSKQIEKFDHTRERMEKLVEEAERRGDKIFTAVKAWLEDAQRIIQKMADFKKDVEQASNSCFHLNSRYHLSKRAKKQAKDIDAKLQQARDFGDRVSYRPPRPPPPPPPPPLMASASYEAFYSRKSITETQRNEETGTFRVCGMGGVGKNTLALQVSKQAQAEKLFDKVVMASSISQTPKIP